MAEKTLTPGLRLMLAGLLFVMSKTSEVDGVTRAVSAAERADPLPADYFELHNLLRALCMAPDWARAEYRPIVKAAIQRLPREDRRKAAQGSDLPYWLDD